MNRINGPLKYVRALLAGAECLIIIFSFPTAALRAEEAAQNTTTAQPLKDEQPVLDSRLSQMSAEERFAMPISLNLNNIDVIEALKFVASKGNLNIVATKNVAGRVTLSLTNIPLKDVFDLMLRSNGLAFIKKGEVFQVMTEVEYKALYGKNFYDARQVKIFRLKYAIPEQAFSLLDAMKSEVGRILVDQESGNVLILDTPERIAQVEDALAEFEKRNIVEVFTLKYAKAKDVEEMLKTRIDAKKVGSIKSDERSNEIIVQTLVNRMEEVRELIASLDKPTKEVLIETKIIRITLSNQLDTGIEWEGIFKLADQSGGATYFGSTPFSTITAGQASPTFQPRTTTLANLNGNIGSYPFSGTTSSLNSSQKTAPGQNMHFGLIKNAADFDAMFNVLKTIGETKVLANPRMVVVNNQEAKIHVGERQAYVTTTTSTGQTTSTVSEEVQFVDVGIQLSVTPTINDDGYVTMKIKPEISSVVSTLITPTKNSIPIIDTSLTETTVMIKDGTTLLIGGMRKEDKVKTYQGLPILSSIPFIGALFRNGTDSTQRNELLVMLTPHIVTPAEFMVKDPVSFNDEGLKDIKEYQPLSHDKTLLPQGPAPAGIEMKPYRDYLSLSQKIDDAVVLKEPRYDADEKFDR